MRKLVVLTWVLTATVAQAQDASREAHIELLRSDVRAGKVEIITEVMAFTEAQSSTFWPVYRKYELELSEITDAKVKLIKEYAKLYDQMTDAKAKQMIKKSFDLEEKQLKLKKKYF